ncbi:hypothetical protein KSP39_PZI012431 [Platanthera zijinensis]|uniref:Uncharacterized protein n=1 Tax=Platanthera zijinensis TaxID=2320716 RepID=A0AAP0BGM0_9ASPA
MMSSRKAKGKGKMSVSKGSRFVNVDAQNRYETLTGKPVIYERGFQIEVQGWSMKYIEHIRRQGWDSFCHPREDAILQWVYEFYTNAPSIKIIRWWYGERLLIFLQRLLTTFST